MIKVKITTNDKIRHVQIPQKWEECSTEIFIRLSKVKDGDILGIFAALIDEDYELLKQSRQVGADKTVARLIKWIKPVDFDKLERRKTITLNGKEIDYDLQISEQTLGQKIIVHQAIAGAESEFDIIPKIIAVYCQPLVSGGEYDNS